MADGVDDVLTSTIKSQWVIAAVTMTVIGNTGFRTKGHFKPNQFLPKSLFTKEELFGNNSQNIKELKTLFKGK